MGRRNVISFPNGLTSAYGYETAQFGGCIATEEDFSSGENTANYLSQDGNNALSVISGGINCTLYRLADVFEKTEPGNYVSGFNDKCGVEVEEIEPVEVAGTTKNFKYACQQLGIKESDGSKALHAAKKKAGLGGADNCVFDLDSGDILYNDEWIGNLYD